MQTMRMLAAAVLTLAAISTTALGAARNNPPAAPAVPAPTAADAADAARRSPRQSRPPPH